MTAAPPAPAPALPPGQAAVLAFVRQYWLDHARPPTTRDIVAALGFSGPNAAVCHLAALERKGAIEWEHGSSRGIWPQGLRAAIRGLLAG